MAVFKTLNKINKIFRIRAPGFQTHVYAISTSAYENLF